MSAVELATLVANNRVTRLRTAIAAHLREQFAEIEVSEHPGKLDFADVLANDTIRCPAAAVAVTRLRPEDRLSGDHDQDVDVTIYVIAEDMMLGDPPLLAKRDEVAWAIAGEICATALGPNTARWGLANIGFPEGVEARPLFTSTTYEKGTVYFVVTWRQKLYAATTAEWIDGEAQDPDGGASS